MLKTIEIDLDVNRAIETARQGFEETPNGILRRLLGIDSAVPMDSTRPRPRLPRSSGAYSTFVDKTAIEANSLKELLRAVILVCAERRGGFLEALSRTSTPRGRHIISPSPEGLYPNSPQLIEYAEPLKVGWWYDSNIGRGQLAAYFKVIAKLAALSTVPTISKRSEKTLMSLADLGL